ncbi:MBL fold metallo-hydrolase [Alteromonas sediminis]|uniref:MBL fold metallo-hydrolase n=1 Tax=Alteromonas sediminis TaxID=2259342 RepID=A0A3N5Z945_9ALTE|nr:MBL fold metallo-hydrolase [Alteromonas sediminis]RPJ65648.1 MBL fold metallo-hydrolase [Alteromonas sediminis]
MKVTFYGVRGSIPSPGAEFVRYGGNTACVHVVLSDGTDVILDSGTGIRILGKSLIEKTTPIYILLSHNHWDHIQGFPFFAPIYQPGREIIINAGATHFDEPDAIVEQMRGSTFPVHPDNLPCDIRFNRLSENQNTWTIGSATITRIALNHPGGGNAYKLEDNGATLAYITDNELYPPYTKETEFLTFVDFAKNVDLLIHDAQYMQTDMPAKSGWGHSIAEEGVKLALASQVKRLALYSHDPERTDNEIDEILEHCKNYIKAASSDLAVIAASEPLCITLP